MNPGRHTQVDLLCDPVTPCVLLFAGHEVQTEVDDAEYVPLPQAVHEVAPDDTTPLPAPISTIDPAAQVKQIDVDDAEYVPLPQAVHEEAPDDTTPVLAPISVMDPAAQVEQTEIDDAE